MQRLRRYSRHPFMVPVAVFITLLLVSLAVGGWLLHSGEAFARPATDIVIISYDHHTRLVPSHEPNVGALLAKLQIPINQGDVVEPSLDTAIHQDDFRINIYRATPVKILDPNGNLVAYSAASTPRSIAKQAGISLYPEDRLRAQAVTNFLQEGAIGNEVVIERSVPVTIDVNGFVAATRTQAKTVEEFLQEKQIALGKTGTVSPAPETLIKPNETISVVRDGTGIQSVTETIPMPQQIVDDPTLAYGTSAIRQAGSDGQQVITYRVTVQNGQVVSKSVIQTVITVQPVTQIIAQGINLSGIKGDMALAGISPDDYAYADYIISHESGWCPTKWQGQWGGCPVYHGTPTASYIGYGLCQATPGYKMASAGADWATNPITQLIWCTGYATSRYGGWYNAYEHWITYHNW